MLPAVAALAALIDWKSIVKKCAGDAVADGVKAGRTSFLRRLQPDETEKIAKQAILLFAEEFLKEIEDKSPLSAAVEGYRDDLKRLLEAAAPDLAAWFQPEVKTVDLTSIGDMWSGMKLAPLPEDFDWPFVARSYAAAIRRYIRNDPALRDQLAIALQQDAHEFEQRFGPGFELQSYRDFLRKKCATLQLSPLHATAYDRRVGLWNVFVPQSARESAPLREIPREILRQLRQEGHVADDLDTVDEEQLARFRASYQSSPVLPIFEILGRQRLVVLLGDPGSGKTSLLKYLVLQWVEQERGPLPLWIDLKEYARQPVGIKQYLESGQTCFGLDARQTEGLLRQGKAALYLDGLDEIFDPPTRGAVIEEVSAFCARYSQAQVIVTSRVIGYEPDRLRNAGFAHATLEDFDDSQVSAFLEKWHAVAETEDAAERQRLCDRLKRATQESRAIRELAGNPLLLTMMAILNRNQELPRDRVELYREASRVLLHEWDASRSLLSTDIFARQEKEALLRELAGAMQQTKGGLAGNLIERSHLHRLFREFLKELGIQDTYQKADSLIEQLTERNFILCFAGAERFSFVHRTFLEYFCAAWFVDRFEKQRTLTLHQIRDDVFGHHWHDERWHEVLRLIAGMVGEKQAEELILFLMSLDGRADKFANLMLAAGCLSEIRNRQAISHTDSALRGRFIREVVRYDPLYYYEHWDEEGETGQTRRKAVGWLASLWRTKDWLGLSAKTDRDAILRMAAIQELARGWKDDPETLPLLRDRARTDENFSVRSTAVLELARGWRDDPETLPLLRDRAGTDEEQFVRSTALQEVARVGKDDPETLPWLRDCARTDDDNYVRMAALQELARGWKNDPETLPLLRDRACTDNHGIVRSAAVEELARGWKDDPETLPLLRDRARTDEDNDVRSTAVQELSRGWKDDPETLPWLLDRARTDENYAVRVEAVKELGRGWKDDPETLPLLRGCARSDRDCDVRGAAVQELARGWKDDPETLPLLRDRARTDVNDDVRMAAVREFARGWKDDPETLPLLLDQARADENWGVRMAAVQELARGWKNDPETLPLLRDRARSDVNYDVRMAAVRELARGWTDNPETLLLLRDRASTDGASPVRRAAVQELARGWKDDPETLPLLRDRARTDGANTVRMAAVQELARGWKDDPETLPLLRERASTDGNELVRMAALQELARGWKNDPEVAILLYRITSQTSTRIATPTTSPQPSPEPSAASKSTA